VASPTERILPEQRALLLEELEQRRRDLRAREGDRADQNGKAASAVEVGCWGHARRKFCALRGH
jgi:hypothetical protein